jgi:hypothetical protein
MIKLLTSYNDELAKVVIKNVAYNAKYISHSIQKQIMQIMFIEVDNFIREESGDSIFFHNFS